MNSFVDALQLKIDLNVKNRRFSISGGSIKDVDVTMHSYGVEATVTFWISEEYEKDKLFSKFVSDSIMEARLSIQGVDYDSTTSPPPPVIVRGVVTEKSLQETILKQLTKEPVFFRRYTIHFLDPARVLWTQHFPTVLYADEKMSAVIKQQVVEGISMKMDWDQLDIEQRIICLGLGDEGNSASFYDFLLWYVDSNGGVLTYNHTKNKYELSDKKDWLGTASDLSQLDVDTLEVRIPEARRHNVSILNSYAIRPGTADVKHKPAVAGISRELLTRIPVKSRFETRKSIEKIRLQSPETELLVRFKKFPSIPIKPGAFVSLDKKYWSSDLYAANKTYRIYETRIRLQSEKNEPEHSLYSSKANYHLEISSLLEEKKDKVVKLPAFEKPGYPILVEGKVLSDTGETGERVYSINKQKKTSEDFYKVIVPLWNQKIVVPFQPNLFPGHFYFPAYKDSRVLLAIDFDHAEIVHFLDWGNGVRLPADSQGNQVLLGKIGSNQTALKHVYEDNKPVFSIERVLETDTELIQMEEGTIILQTKEDESLKMKGSRFDVTPNVEAARASLSAETRQAITGITSGFSSTKSEVNGEFESAVTDTEEALERLNGEISAKVSAVKGQLNSAMDQLGNNIGTIKGKSEAAKKELKKKLSL